MKYLLCFIFADTAFFLVRHADLTLCPDFNVLSCYFDDFLIIKIFTLFLQYNPKIHHPKKMQKFQQDQSHEHIDHYIENGKHRIREGEPELPIPPRIMALSAMEQKLGQLGS